MSDENPSDRLREERATLAVDRASLLAETIAYRREVARCLGEGDPLVAKLDRIMRQLSP